MAKAEDTRRYILQKAFELVYSQGYQTTSIDVIIATTKVTKGAFYYHFKTKDEMGIAMIKEILDPSIIEGFADSLRKTTDPNKEIYALTNYLLFEDPMLLVKYGCPVSNLTQEMTPWNKQFTFALASLVSKWKALLVSTIKRGIKSGYYRRTTNPDQVCNFLLSGYWGIRNLGKLTNSSECYKGYLKELKTYLNSLK